MQHLQTLLQTHLEQLPYGAEPPELYEPLRYMMSLGGKRLRPLLTLLGADLFSAEPEKAVQPALGVEVFHNFTLMHDDIMDQAPLRRGKPTVHALWSPTIAILSGDVMLVKAYELIMQVEDPLLRPVLELFNRCAADVCEGQQLDMNFETEEEVTLDAYLNMIRLKTAVLLGFSLQLGALIGGAPEADADLLRQFGTHTGIAFQLKDDLLDVFADSGKFGKQVGGDIRSNKKTFLLLTALQQADAAQHTQLLHWLQDTTTDPEEKVQAVTRLYEALQVKRITEQQMKEHFTMALDCLELVKAPAEKIAALRSFAEDLMFREQ